VQRYRFLVVDERFAAAAAAAAGRGSVSGEP